MTEIKIADRQLEKKHRCHRCGYKGYDYAETWSGSNIILCPACKYDGDDGELGYEIISDEIFQQLEKKHKCHNCGYAGFDYKEPWTGSNLILCPSCKYDGDRDELGFEPID